MEDPAIRHGGEGAAGGGAAVNTGGGAYVGGVNTQGGDFAGRDLNKTTIEHIGVFIQEAASAVEEREKQKQFEARGLAEAVVAFAERLRASAQPSAGAGRVYKGLLDYRLGDAGLFFGRDEAAAEFDGKLGDRLTVLQAQSGAGKSSFLQAKVSPALLAAGHLPIYLRYYKDCSAADVKRIFLTDPEQLRAFGGTSLRGFFLEVCKVLPPQSRLYVMLDQFEDVLTRAPDGAAALADEIAECVSDAALNVRWVLSLRKDYFGDLARFEKQLRPFANQYLLKPLSRAEAEEAIVRPAAKAGVKFDQDVVTDILDELLEKKGGDSVAPPQLQMVCLALHEAARDATHITRTLYNSLGGAEGILRDYLDRALKSLADEERQIAPKLLEALVDSERRRVRRTAAELKGARSLAEAGAGVVESTLASLSEHRLLRDDEDEATGVTTYELAHDHLVERINLDGRTLKRKRAQEMLDNRVRAFQEHKILLTSKEFGVITPYWNELAIGDDAKKLIDKSVRQIKRKNFFTAVFSIMFFSLLFASAILGVVWYRAEQTIERAADATRRLYENNGLVPVGENPRALAFDGERVWVASAGSFRLQGIDPQTGALDREVALERIPGLLHFDGKRLWVGNAVHGSVQAVDPQTLKTDKLIALPGYPRAMTSDGRRLWVSLYNTRDVAYPEYAVVAVDLTTGERGRPLPVGEWPEAVAFDGKRVWVANKNDSTVQSIDPDSGTAGEPISLPSPDLLAFDGKRLWAGSKFLGTLIALDPETGLIIPKAATGQDGLQGQSILDETIYSLTFHASRLWVTTAGNNIRAIDPETLEVSEPIKVGATPLDVAFDGLRLWVVNQGDSMMQSLDPASAFVGKPVPLRAPGVSDDALSLITLAAAGNVLYAAGRDVLLPLDISKGAAATVGSPAQTKFCAERAIMVGEKLWLTDNCTNSLQVFDLRTGSFESPLHIGGEPAGMVFDGKRLWVVNETKAVVQAVNPVTRSVEAEIALGKFPGQIAFGGKRLWVATEDGLQVLDPATARGVSTSDYSTQEGLPAEPVLIARGPASELVFAAGRVWAESSSGSVLAIEPETQKVERIDLGEGRKLFAFDGSRLWVGNSGRNTLRAIDTKNLNVGRPVNIGAELMAMAFDGKRLWLAYNHGKVVQPVTVR